MGDVGENNDVAPKLTAENMSVGDLILAIDGLSRALATHRKQLQKTDRRSVWGRRLAIIAVVASVLAGAAAWRAIVLNNAVINARKGSCIAYNIGQEQIIESEAQHDKITADNIVPPATRTPTEQRAVDVYLAQENASTESGHKFRLCTKAGIAAYSKTGQRDPANGAPADRFLPGQVPANAPKPTATTSTTIAP